MIKKLFNWFIHWQYFHFLIVGTIGTSASALVLYCMTEYGHIWYMGSFIIGSLVGSVINYLLNKHWTFRK